MDYDDGVFFMISLLQTRICKSLGCFLPFFAADAGRFGPVDFFHAPSFQWKERILVS